jgi:hypothetical protein
MSVPSFLNTDWQGVVGVWDKEGKLGSAEQQGALRGDGPFSHDDSKLEDDTLFLSSKAEPENSLFFLSS